MHDSIGKMYISYQNTPSVIDQVIARQDEILDLVKRFKITTNTRIFLVGNGSSGEGLQVAAYQFERYLQIKPFIVSPYQFVHYPVDLTKDDLVIALSQTGTSHLVVEAIRISIKVGAQTLGITADGSSPLCKTAEHSLVLTECQEFCDYKISGVVGNTVGLLMVAWSMAWNLNRISASDIKSNLEALVEVYRHYPQNYELINRWVKDNFNLLQETLCFSIIGSGPMKAVAEELAIKLIEVVNVPCNFFDLEEYLHGGCATTVKNHLVIVIADVYSDAYAWRVYQAIRDSGRKVLWLGPHHEGKLQLTTTKQPLLGCLDGFGWVHSLVISLGFAGDYGSAGQAIFQYYQEQLTVREN